MYTDLVKGSGIQSNQFLIVDGDHEAVIDPGGDLTYAPLSIEISKHTNLRDLDFILASHQDPDIISALGRWMMQTNAKVVCSKLWARFLPHLASSYMDGVNGSTPLSERIIAVPDGGQPIALGDSLVYAVPAHFLHSVGNFQFYDAKSKILFSGDMGASMCAGDEHVPVDDFDAHIPLMKGFHQRYMCSKKACQLWANMVREMDIDMIVPQHGRRFEGKNIHRFLDWISDLPCGVDLLNQNDFSFSQLAKQNAGLTGF
jgi:flavorubredoxin